MSYEPIIIFGLGTLGRCATQYFYDYSAQGIVTGFTVDPDYLDLSRDLYREDPSWTLGAPIVPFEKDAIIEHFGSARPRIFLAIGYNDHNRKREDKFHQCREWGFDVASFIHPSASIAGDAKIGDGIWIQEHCNIQNDVLVGDGYIGWASSHVGHSSILEPFVYQTTNSTICGNCHIEKNSFIAANSVIFPRVKLGNHSIVGAGAIITKDTDPYSVYDFGKDNKKR